MRESIGIRLPGGSVPKVIFHTFPWRRSYLGHRLRQVPLVRRRDVWQPTAAVREGRVMLKKPVEQPEGLIRLLFDPEAEYGDRDDAAMDLAAYDELEAEAALVEVASNSATDPELADTCGESIAEIWERKNKLDLDVFKRLTPPARRIVVRWIELKRPAWESRLKEALEDTGREV